MNNSSTPVSSAFSSDMAQRYDERNRKLSRISSCLHFLMCLTLKELPVRSRILCVGAGTGAEILALAEAFPEWRFVALDPSSAMLDVCRARLKEAGIEERCEFIHGYVNDLPEKSEFNAALSVLVGHFVKQDERVDFYRGMTRRLLSGGYFLNAEISFDLNSKEFPSMLKCWESVQELMGASPESLASLPKLLREALTVLPPTTVEELIRQSGIGTPVRFFQAFMIHGWYGKKE